MLVAVVVLFTICWSPYLIDNVLMSFHLLPVARTGSLKHMRIALCVLRNTRFILTAFLVSLEL